MPCLDPAGAGADVSVLVSRNRISALTTGPSSPAMPTLSFDRQEGFAELRILDSTDPAQVRHVEGVDLASALSVVSNRSGSTLEPNIFEHSLPVVVIGVSRRGDR